MKLLIFCSSGCKKDSKCGHEGKGEARKEMARMGWSELGIKHTFQVYGPANFVNCLKYLSPHNSSLSCEPISGIIHN